MNIHDDVCRMCGGSGRAQLLDGTSPGHRGHICPDCCGDGYSREARERRIEAEFGLGDPQVIGIQKAKPKRPSKKAKGRTPKKAPAPRKSVRARRNLDTKELDEIEKLLGDV